MLTGPETSNHGFSRSNGKRLGREERYRTVVSGMEPRRIAEVMLLPRMTGFDKANSRMLWCQRVNERNQVGAENAAPWQDTRAEKTSSPTDFFNTHRRLHSKLSSRA